MSKLSATVFGTDPVVTPASLADIASPTVSSVDQQWGAEQLQEFVSMIEQLVNLRFKVQVVPISSRNKVEAEIRELTDRICTHEPAVQIIMDAVDPKLRSYASVVRDDDWQPARKAALTALGLLTVGAEAKKRMQPDAPELAADRFHPWVWEAARPMWNAGSWQTAVLHAAQSVNVRLQQKLDRHNSSEVQLCQEAFSSDDPERGKARLRFPGKRDTDTGKSLQVGALSFSVGCFKALRNPVAHNHEHPLQMQEALEQLAALSVLARWIDSCEVDAARE